MAAARVVLKSDPIAAEQPGGRPVSPVETLLARPMLVLAIAFASGILAGDGWPAGLIVVIALGWICTHRNFGRGFGLLAAILAVAVLGAIHYRIALAPAPDDVARVGGQGFRTIRGRIASDVNIYRAAVSCQIAVDEVAFADGRVVPCSGRIAARLSTAGQPPHLDFGDRVEARGRLSAPAHAGNSGGFDYAAFLAHHHVFSTFIARRASEWTVLPDSARAIDWWPRLASRCRASLIDSLGRVLPHTEAGLLAGIMLGARTDLPKDLNDDFVATGTVHVLATAGLHVGAFALLVAWLCRKSGLPRHYRAMLLLCLLITYAIMAGARPSVVRAVVMAAVIVTGLILEREPDIPNALGFAALSLLVVEPGILFDAGFQLSFATVGTLVAMMPLFEPAIARARKLEIAGPAWLSRRIGPIAGGTATVLAVSFAAQVGSAPILAQHFNQVSLIGVLANALIVPAVIWLLGMGFTVWLLVLTSLIAGRLMALILSAGLAYVIGAARFFAHVPFAFIDVPSPGWLLISLYYAILGWIVLRIRHGRSDAPSGAEK